MFKSDIGGIVEHVRELHAARPREQFRFLQGWQVADITVDGMHALADLGSFIKTGRGWGRQRKTCQRGAKVLQPQRQPASLEAGMSGKENPFSAPKIRRHFQTFQGAWPLAQSSSR